ncbi:RBBP9/YdeN family alpha/beta hydrolase [Arthrobacter halodurans]
MVHGYTADPHRHWFPWLTNQLASRGVQVQAVVLPNPTAPDPRAWLGAFAAALATPDDDTWVIAHSLGAITAFGHLATLPLPWSLGGLVAVSGFTDPLPGLPELDGFVSSGVDFQPIVANVARRIVVRSDNDTTVPPSATDALAKRLRTEPVETGAAGRPHPWWQPKASGRGGGPSAAAQGEGAGREGRVPFPHSHLERNSNVSGRTERGRCAMGWWAASVVVACVRSCGRFRGNRPERRRIRSEEAC